MTDGIKIINGSPQPGHPGFNLPRAEQGLPLVSTKLNADGKLPEIKPEGDRIINGAPQPGHPTYGEPPQKRGVRIVPAQITSEE